MGTRITSRTTVRGIVVTGFALGAFALPVGVAAAAAVPAAATASDTGPGTSPGAAPAPTDGLLVNGWQ